MIRKHEALVYYECDACHKNKTASAYIFGGRLSHNGKAIMLCDGCIKELAELIEKEGL